MEKKLYAWVLMNDLLATDILKTDARTLQVWFPFRAWSPKYVWANSEEEAKHLAIKWCEKQLREASSFMELKRPFKKEFYVHILGIAEDIEMIGDIEYAYGVRFDQRKYVFRFASQYKSEYIKSGNVINPENEGYVRKVSQEEIAQALRENLRVVH